MTRHGALTLILVSLLVLRSAWRLLKDSVNELLEGAPVSLDIAELKRRLCREIPEVRNVHHVHVWMVGEKPVMTLHVQVIPPHDHDALLDQIQHYLMDHYQIEHATIQMEYQPCHGPDCHLNEGCLAIHIITINGTARVNLFRVRC